MADHRQAAIAAAAGAMERHCDDIGEPMPSPALARALARAAIDAAEPHLAAVDAAAERERIAAEFAVTEARATLAAWDAERGGHNIYGTERTLADHLRNVLDLLTARPASEVTP